MNCKILIIVLFALCCLQLALAKEGEPIMRRNRSKRLNRTPSSSKSPRRSRTKPTIKRDDSGVDPTAKSPDTNKPIQIDCGTKRVIHTNFLGGLSFGPSGELNYGMENPELSRPPVNAKIASGIPVQQPRTTVTVEGKNGNISVNGEVKYADDETLNICREVHVQIQDGNFYVNNNLVMKKGRSDHDKVFPSMHNLDYDQVIYFVLKIHSDGTLDYKDNKKGSLNINYYTPLDSMKSFWNYLSFV